jgi:selenium metabolism protein YedF
MAKEIDARGRPCPQPVLMTKKAVEAGETVIEVLVDNEGAVQNVTRFAEKEGFEVKVERVGPDFKLYLKKGEASSIETSQPVEIVCATGTWRINRGQVLYIKSDQVGRGSDELGSILTKALINTLAENDALPDKLVLLNSGVKLVCEGSELIDSLKAIEKKGVEILACGTCLNYYGLTEKVRVGRISNAFEILNTLLEAERIVDLA